MAPEAFDLFGFAHEHVRLFAGLSKMGEDGQRFVAFGLKERGVAYERNAVDYPPAIARDVERAAVERALQTVVAYQARERNRVQRARGQKG
jgi:hypothetical protein